MGCLSIDHSQIWMWLCPFPPTINSWGNSSFSFFPFSFFSSSVLLSLLFPCIVPYRFCDKDDAACGAASSFDHLLYRLYPPLLPVVRYIEQYRNRLDGRRFYAMYLAGDANSVMLVLSVRNDTTVVAWIMQWWHWDGWGAIDSLCYYIWTESPCICCFEEVACEQCTYVIS